MECVYGNVVLNRLASGREAQPIVNQHQRDACRAVCRKIARAACEPGVTMCGIYLPEEIVNLIAMSLWPHSIASLETLQCVSWSFRCAFWIGAGVRCCPHRAVHVAVHISMRAPPSHLAWWESVKQEENDMEKFAVKCFFKERFRIERDRKGDTQPSHKRARER